MDLCSYICEDWPKCRCLLALQAQGQQTSQNPADILAGILRERGQPINDEALQNLRRLCEEPVEVPEGLRLAYLEAKLQKVLPLFQEARDALTAITEMQRKLHEISPTLADRMDEAGTFSFEDWVQQSDAQGGRK